MITPFEQAVASNLEGVSAFSTGVCAGCDECLRNHGYTHKWSGNLQRKKAQADWESGKWSDESGFTWSDCPSCGMTLGHDGYVGHGIVTVPVYTTVTVRTPQGLVKKRVATKRTKQVMQHYDGICTDCVCYHANGDIPESWEDE
jgi:hypothetical protein